MVAEAGNALAGAGVPGVYHLLVDQVAGPPAASAVTYTPMRRQGVANPAGAAQAKPPSAPVPVSPAPVYVTPAPAPPTYVAPAPAAPAPAPSIPAATTWAPSGPYTPAPPSPMSGTGLQAPPIRETHVEPNVGIAAKALRASPTVHRVFGVATDVGMPDGLNLGLVVAPADWVRLGASVGTNSASLDYRGGLSLIPMGWGPSFSLEVGHCNTAATTGVIRTFFTVPAWVQPYVQQLGYTYVNAHVGFDYRLGRVTLYVHGGYSYLAGTVRSPNPVVVDSTTNTTIKIVQDGNVSAYTLSAKVGIVTMFGGH